MKTWHDVNLNYFRIVKMNMENMFSKHECVVYIDEIWYGHI